VGVDPNLRAQTLSLEDWHRLYEEFDKESRSLSTSAL
jgi:hypothetical protein